MPTPANSLNISQTGLVNFDGVNAFTGVTVTQFNLLVGGASNTITSVAPSGIAGIPIISNGAGSNPSFGTALVIGGGTGLTTLTNHGILVGAGTSAITQLAAGLAGQVLQSGGASADPAYSTSTFPTTATSTGTLLRANGTNWVATTSTYPNTNALNTLLYASSANVMAALATATNGVLITDGTTGIPSISSTLPTAVQGNITSTGTVTSGTWNGTAIDVAHGGTGRATLTAHGVLVGNGTTAITQLAAGSAGQALLSGGASADPAYSTPTYPSASGAAGTILRSDATNNVYTTATYPNTATTGDLIYASATNVIGNLADVGTGQVLTSGGVGAVPAYSATPTVTSITFGAGTALSIFAQGTFTPTLSGNGTPTYVNQIGRYQKVGRIVTIYIAMNWSSIASNAGNLTVGSLPFTSVSVSNVGACGTWFSFGANIAPGAGTTPILSGSSNVTTLGVDNMNVTTGGTAAIAAGAGAGGLEFNLSYETV